MVRQVDLDSAVHLILPSGAALDENTAMFEAFLGCLGCQQRSRFLRTETRHTLAVADRGVHWPVPTCSINIPYRRSREEPATTRRSAHSTSIRSQ